MLNKLSILTGMIVLGSIVTNASQAEAIIYDWQLTNEDGTVGLSTDIIQGEIVFDDGDVFPNAGNVTPTSFRITSIDNISSYPMFSNGLDIEINNNLNLTFFAISFDENEEIDLSLSTLISGSGTENFFFNRSGAASFYDTSVLSGSQSNGQFMDSDFSSFQFSQQAVPVPFEISPTLGFLIVGGIWGVSRLRKRMITRRSASQELDRF